MAENTQEKDDFEWLTNPSKENTESSLQVGGFKKLKYLIRYVNMK